MTSLTPTLRTRGRQSLLAIAMATVLVCYSTPLVSAFQNDADGQGTNEQSESENSAADTIVATGLAYLSLAQDAENKLSPEEIAQLKEYLSKLDAQYDELHSERQELIERIGLAERAATGLTWEYYAADDLRNRADYLDSLAQYSALVEYYQAQEQTTPSLWIGVRCISIPEDVRSYLELEEQIGILVDEVIDESPASEASVEVRDVILSVEETTITSVQDLVTCIQERENEPLRIGVLRKGAPVELVVTPRQRPEASATDVALGAVDSATLLSGLYTPKLSGEVYGTLVLDEHAENGDAALVLSATQIEYLSAFPMPDDVTVTVSQSGSEEASLVITKGDEEKCVSLSELSTLSPDFQLYALTFLCRANKAARLVPQATGRYLYGYDEPTYYQYGGFTPYQRYNADAMGAFRDVYGVIGYSEFETENATQTDEASAEGEEEQRATLEEIQKQLDRLQSMIEEIKK